MLLIKCLATGANLVLGTIVFLFWFALGPAPSALKLNLMAQGFLLAGILAFLLAYVERLYLRLRFYRRALTFAWPCFYLATLEITAANASKFDGFTYIFFSSWLLVVLAAIFLGDGLAKYVASRSRQK